MQTQTADTADRKQSVRAIFLVSGGNRKKNGGKLSCCQAPFVDRYSLVEFRLFTFYLGVGNLE